MACVLSFDADESKENMGNIKAPKDWKFYSQLTVLLLTIGGGIQIARHALDLISDLKAEVRELKTDLKSKNDSIIRMEGRFDLLELQIKQLRERLEAKKIVNSTAFDSSHLSGENYFESK